MEGEVGPVRSWFLSDCGLRFPASWAPTLSPELPACRESVSAPISALSSHCIPPEPTRHEAANLVLCLIQNELKSWAAPTDSEDELCRQADGSPGGLGSRRGDSLPF